MPPLTAVALMFLLSLGGAFVLFKLLKSAALIKRAGYQAGGALAGFLLIFGTLAFTYNDLVQSGAAMEIKEWDIRGTVILKDETLHSEIEVLAQPLSPYDESQSNGKFYLKDVRMTADEVTQKKWPVIKFSKEGFYGVDLLPHMYDDFEVEVDHTNSLILLKEPVILDREAEEGEFDDLDEVEEGEVDDLDGELDE